MLDQTEMWGIGALTSLWLQSPIPNKPWCTMFWHLCIIASILFYSSSVGLDQIRLHSPNTSKTSHQLPFLGTLLVGFEESFNPVIQPSQFVYCQSLRSLDLPIFRFPTQLWELTAHLLPNISKPLVGDIVTKLMLFISLVSVFNVMFDAYKVIYIIVN